jgi:hypothetical protein
LKATNFPPEARHELWLVIQHIFQAISQICQIRRRSQRFNHRRTQFFYQRNDAAGFWMVQQMQTHFMRHGQAASDGRSVIANGAMPQPVMISVAFWNCSSERRA